MRVKDLVTVAAGAVLIDLCLLGLAAAPGFLADTSSSVPVNTAAQSGRQPIIQQR